MRKGLCGRRTEIGWPATPAVNRASIIQGRGKDQPYIAGMAKGQRVTASRASHVTPLDPLGFAV